MKNLLVTVLMGIAVTTVGCKPSSFKANGKSEINRMSCVSQKAVDTEHLAIQGDSGASPGQTVHYKLNEDVNCSPSQTVSWASASGKPLGDGSVVTSTYRKPGAYVVTAQVQEKGAAAPYAMSFKTVVTAGLGINAPQIGVAETDSHFELVVPVGVGITNAVWNFGDGQPQENSLGPIEHTFYSAGTYNVTVTATLADGDTSVATHTIQILPANDIMNCANQLAISGPTTTVVGSPISLSLFIPTCMTTYINRLSWNFADGSPSVGTQTVQHTYTTPGAYHVTVGLYTGEQQQPFATLSIDIVVAPGGEDPGGDDGTDPGTDPNECSEVGQQRQINGELYTENASCGVNGSRTDSYRDVVQQQCNVVGDIRRWVETGRSKQLISEGACMGQACEVPASALNGANPATLGLLLIGGKYYLADGASKTFYSSTTPTGACSTVAETRSCSNGQLGGSTAHSNLVCHEPCPGFGAHGTVKTGVITGSESVPKVCPNGETGIFDIFNQVSEQMCKDGQVLTSNTMRGTLKTPGECPTYVWAGSESYSACSAACGGEQQRMFECRNSSTGELAPADRCVGPAPVVKRVCDGNPEAVKRSESETIQEDGGMSDICPENQIGVISRVRQVVVTSNYACIDHAVKVASTTRQEGPWQEEKYCRDYVPYRCSHDSLSPTQATGRYQWMLKCAASVPMIKDFLAGMDRYESGKGKSTNTLYFGGHEVYATFMNRAYKPEKTWKAPTDASGSCVLPETVYIAAVCSASCARPEEMIMGQREKNGKLQYAPFLQSWQEKFAYVGTLQSNSSMSAKRVVRTAVDNWVTELEDTDHEIVNFVMKSGGRVSLTTNHPVLTADGRMKEARDFQVGESMVRLGGELDEIVSAEVTQYHGKVYNVFVKSASLHKNIVVTNGYLNGTAYFQNEGKKHLNRVLFRNNLTHGVFGK
ncbi:MAG: PKD domain-containing protein [Bdellovibrionales bacterium]|nr:PKD domain-containing protein [Bdellovibrionales bacterium]